MGMGVLKGQNLRLKISDGVNSNKFVAFATACTLHLSANMEESSTKDSTNNFQEQEVTGVSWDVSTDALYSIDNSDATGHNGEKFIHLMINQTKVGVEFVATEPGSTKNRGFQAGTVFYGDAYITDVSVNGTNRQNASYTVQFTGVGELQTKSETAAGI